LCLKKKKKKEKMSEMKSCEELQKEKVREKKMEREIYLFNEYVSE
jgi:hypothetical protein